MNRTSILALTIAAVVLAALSTGCASRMVPFTHEIRSQYRLTEQELKSLQFYVSHTVTLKRELESDSRRVEGGNLHIRSGKLIEEVVVKEQTPGVAVAVGDDTISVSFQEGTALDFSLRNHRGAVPLRKLPAESSRFAEPPTPFPGDVGPDPEPKTIPGFGNYWLTGQASSSLIIFQGREFEAVGDSDKAHLLIDTQALEEVVEERTVLEGRRVSTRSGLHLVVL